MSKRIYLASPYTSNSEYLRQMRYEAVCKATASLIANGNIVFSPIAHSHPLVRYGLRGDFEYWREWCLSFIKDWATDFYILTLPEWENSRGIIAERAEAEKMKLPITFLEME